MATRSLCERWIFLQTGIRRKDRKMPPGIADMAAPRKNIFKIILNKIHFDDYRKVCNFLA
jgi:hypothetical protein